MSQSMFTPFSFAGINLRNRIVFPPLTTCLAESNGKISSRMVRYYQERAAGGAGMIIVEPGTVNARAKLGVLSAGAWDDSQVPGLKKLAATIKEAGAAAVLQLCHAGPKGISRINGVEPVSASEILFYPKQPPRALDPDAITAIVKDFTAAAYRAKEAGFDAVELHVAHFYLLSAFLSPLTNNREDAYGGDNAGRARITVEIIQAIKSKVAKDFPVICRYHGYEDAENGLKTKDAVEIGRIFQAAGADALHISAYGLPVPELAGKVTVPSTSIPLKEHPQAPFVEYAAAVKQAVNIPVIAVGKITEPEVCEQILRDDKCDLVAVGRGLLVDPQFPNKILSGRTFVRCLGCNDCLNSIAKGEISCRVNKQLVPA